MKRFAWPAAKWGAGVLLIAALVWLNWSNLREAAQLSLDFRFLLLAGLVCLTAVFLTFLRWFVLVRAQELPFRPIDAVRLGFIGYFFNQFLPGAVSGDLVKAGFIAREQDRRTVAISTILIDRVVGLVGLIALVSLMAGIFWAEVREIAALRYIAYFVWTLAGAGVLGVLFVAVLPVQAPPIIDRLTRVPRVGVSLAEIVRALQMYRNKYRFVALAVVLAVLGHAGFVVTFYLSSRAVESGGPTPPLAEHFLIIPVGMVIQSVPLTPGNLGTNEEAYKRLYHLVEPSLADSPYDFKGGWACLAQRLVTWSVALIGLGFYIPLRRTALSIGSPTVIRAHPFSSNSSNGKSCFSAGSSASPPNSWSQPST